MGENPLVFPIRDANEHPGPMGLTLRDWFAGQALAGATTTISGIGDCTAMERQMMLSQLADLIFEISDAMLAARSAE